MSIPVPDCITFRPGTTVLIGDKAPMIEATVLAVTIREDGASYEVSWWDGKKRYSAWLSQLEVHPYAQQPDLKIGFHYDNVQPSIDSEGKRRS